MNNASRRGAKEGIGFGIIAGVVFLLFEILHASVVGVDPLLPLRMAGSVVLGSSALDSEAAGSVWLIGIVVHLVLAAFFGLVYGLINAQFSPKTETDWGSQIGIGIVFGAALWLINFQIIARAAYPWFLETSGWAQVLLHAFAFGVPLGIMYAAAERKVQHVGPVRHRAV